jgi:hypothetical protein
LRQWLPQYRSILAQQQASMHALLPLLVLKEWLVGGRRMQHHVEHPPRVDLSSSREDGKEDLGWVHLQPRRVVASLADECFSNSFSLLQPSSIMHAPTLGCDVNFLIWVTTS